MNRARAWRPKSLVNVFSSLRGRLIALGLLAACPAVLLTFHTDEAWRDHAIQGTNRYALGMVRLAAEHHRHVAEGVQDLLVSVAQIPAVRRSDPVECPKILTALRHGFPYYADFGVIQANGQLSCSAVPVHAPINFADFPAFRRVMETGGFVSGGYHVARGKSLLHFAVPIRNRADSIQAVLFVGLDLEWFTRDLADIDLPTGSTVTLMNQDGVILARGPESAEWVGRSAPALPVVQHILGARGEGTTVMQDLDGVQRLMAFTPLARPVPGDDLYLVVGIPLTTALADADRNLFRSLAALGVTGIAIALLAWLGSDVVVLRRLRALLTMTQRLTAGDLGARSGISKGPGELNQLAAAFDTMAAELQKRHAEAAHAEEALREANEALEWRVQERTAHLIVANEAQQVALRDLKRTEAHLAEQEAQLTGIIASAMEAIITFDEDQRIIVFNRAAERMFGVPASEAIGRPVDRFIPDGFPAAHDTGLVPGPAGMGSRIGSEGLPFAVRAGGEKFPIEGAVAQVEIRGETLSTIILRDISERLKAEENLRKLSLAMEQIAESVFITNRNAIIEYVNPAFERLTGYRREEAIGRTPSLLRSGAHDATFYEGVWQTILSGEIFSGVFLNRKKNGDEYYEARTITPLRGDGRNITHFVASGRDVTQRKRTGEALRRLNDQLEREAERIAHAVHDVAGQLLSSAHITLADLGRGLSPEAQKRVTAVREHLAEVEAHLRRLSHELRPRILDDLGLDAALEFLAEGIMKRTGIVVTVEVALEDRLPPVVETTLYRLIQEATTNAARHAQPTRIGVRVTQEAQTIRCVVWDDGVGFDVPEVLTRRGDASLGLVGTRDRVEALSGTLAVASAAGEGTELVVLIPLEHNEF